MHSKFNLGVQATLRQTLASLRDIAKAYQAATGDIARRTQDIVVETAVSVIQVREQV